MNYKKASEVLNKRDSKKIGNNTYLHKIDNETIGLRLHLTDVLTFHADGKVVYNSGGWRTSTTKDRMTNFGPAHIWQKAGEWFIDGEVYQDGVVWKDGKIEGAGKLSEVKQRKKDLKAVKSFVAAYMNEFFSGNMPTPSGGDCWGCCMVSDDGKTAFGTDHLFQHIQENYFVPSLILRATERFPISPMAKNAFAYVWNPEVKETMPEFIKRIAFDQMKKSLYQYMKSCLLLAA